MTANTKNKRCLFCSATDIVRGLAWFTTQAKATLATGTMTVSTVSNITINVTKLGYDTSTATAGRGFGSQVQSAEDSGVALGPVSSADGLTFYAPTALKTGEVGDTYVDSDMAAVGDSSSWGNSNDYVGYVKYGIHVEANADTGNARTLKYKITPQVDDTELTAAYRVALYKATYSSGYVAGAKIGIYSNVAGTKTAWDSTKSATDAFNTTSYTTTAISGVASAQNLPGAAAVTVTTASAINEYYIFSVWVEGCDAGATNTGISGATLSVAIEFSLA